MVHIRYTAWGGGAGAPVLLIHGIQGRGALWEQVARGLAERGYLVFAHDLRGHGASGRSADYSLTAHVGDAAALLERLGAGAAHVVGHSLGGRIAWELAAARPELVRSLVIEDQHPDADATVITPWEEWAATWPARFDSPEAGVAYVREHGRSVDWWAPSLTPLPDGAWGWAFDIPGVVETVRQLQRQNGWASLARVRAPALLIRGAESTHLTAAVAERMASTLARGQLHTVAGAGHWVHRDPKPYVEIVAAFLAVQ